MSNQIMENRFVRRERQEPVRGKQDTYRTIPVKILQQRLKNGAYAQWGEWHDVPTVEPEDE